MSAAAASPEMSDASPAARDAALRAPIETPKPQTPAETPRRAVGNSLFSFVNAEKEDAAARTASGGAVSSNPVAPSGASAQAREASLTNTPPAEAPVSYITEKSPTDRDGAGAASVAAMRLTADSQAMHAGERRRLKLLLKTDAPLGLVALTFRLDPRVLAVRSVGAGALFKTSDAQLTHTATPEGLLLVTVTPNSASAAVRGAGTLLVFDVEALAPGAEALRFVADDVHVVATDGRRVQVKVMTDEFSVVK
jgi:hypothetical protein